VKHEQLLLISVVIVVVVVAPDQQFQYQSSERRSLAKLKDWELYIDL